MFFATFPLGAHKKHTKNTQVLRLGGKKGVFVFFSKFLSRDKERVLFVSFTNHFPSYMRQVNVEWEECDYLTLDVSIRAIYICYCIVTIFLGSKEWTISFTLFSQTFKKHVDQSKSSSWLVTMCCRPNVFCISTIKTGSLLTPEK